MGISRRAFLGSSAAFWVAGDVLGSDLAVPSYWKGALDSATRKILGRAKSFPFGFFFLTDIHTPSNRLRSGLLLADLVRRTPIRRVVFGGDLPESWSGSDVRNRPALDSAVRQFRELWRDPIEAAGGDFFAVKGNHDFTICSEHDKSKRTSFTYTAKDAASVITGTAAFHRKAVHPSDPEATYYYVDDEKVKVRFVFVDTSDTVDLKKKWWNVQNGTNKRQLWWLAENAFLTMKDGWSAVVVHHVPIVGVLTWGNETVVYQRLRNLLEAYQNRGACEIAGRTYDFAAARGRIVLDITGHYHAERQTFKNGILHVTQPCDAVYDNDTIAGRLPWCGNLPGKKRETAYEHAFDAVQLDPAGDRIAFTRIGAGQDRLIHIRPVRMKAGERRRFKATELKGAIRWGCYDADRITRDGKDVRYYNDVAVVEEDGVLVARKTGEAMVLAMDEKLTKEIFPVEVV